MISEGQVEKLIDTLGDLVVAVKDMTVSVDQNTRLTAAACGIDENGDKWEFMSMTDYNKRRAQEKQLLQILDKFQMQAAVSTNETVKRVSEEVLPYLKELAILKGVIEDESK